MRIAVSADALHLLQDKGALSIIIHGQAGIVNGHALGPIGKAGLAPVKGQRQQLVIPRRCVHRFKAILLRKGLVGQPGLLLGRAQHAHARLALRPGVRQAVFHQFLAIALALEGPVHPQTVDVHKAVALHGHPGRFHRRVFDEHHALGVQLAEHMPLLQPLRQPFPLGLHPGVGLFAADDAAQMLACQVFRGQVDPFLFHCASSPSFCMLRHSMAAFMHMQAAVSLSSSSVRFTA